MKYIDFSRLEAIDSQAYLEQKPYPWINPEGLLTDEGFRALYEDLPSIDGFERSFGVKRRAGQKPHDRYALEYTDDTPLPRPWLEFIEELKGDRYRKALCRIVGVEQLELNFHWHYSGNGTSVSPHCDSKRKLGSHIFYFNLEDTWDPGWGGETVVLDDGGRIATRSAPEFEDFDHAISSESMGNRSLIFTRRGNAWHGVREIHCPEDRYRKVFIVVLNRADALYRLRAKLMRKKFARY